MIEDLNKPLRKGVPTWGEILWTDRKQRRSIARLVDECNLLWWWFKAMRLVEISDHDSILAGMKGVIQESNAATAERMAKGIAMSKEEFLQGATEKGHERRTYLEVYRLLLRGGLQVSFENMMKRAQPREGLKEAWQEYTDLATAYAPFLAWNRKLYSFDAKAWELITANPLDLTWRQAATMFDAFPGNTVCIEVPEGIELPGSPRYLIGGAFANMERGHKEPLLLLVSLPHTREPWERVETAMSWVFQDSNMLYSTDPEDGMAAVAPFFLCAVAYLQARPEDRTPRPLKQSKKIRRAADDLELPEPLEVGVRLGQSIRLLEQQRDEVIRENLRTPEGRKRPVPHWRSPHHHIYWTGSDRKTPVVKWVDAVIVNKDLGEVGVVQHKVTK